jgi:hypothetical protein
MQAIEFTPHLMLVSSPHTYYYLLKRKLAPPQVQGPATDSWEWQGENIPIVVSADCPNQTLLLADPKHFRRVTHEPLELMEKADKTRLFQGSFEIRLEKKDAVGIVNLAFH